MNTTQAFPLLNRDEMLDSLPFAIYVVDVRSNRVRYGNAFFRTRFPDWQTQPCHKLINGLDEACARCRRADLLDSSGQPNDESLSYEFFNEYDECWYQIEEKATLWDDGEVVQYVIAIDISRLKEAQKNLAEAHIGLMLKHQELEHVASTDSLTQIHNREKLGRIFAQEIALTVLGKREFSIISADLDHFKSVNDNFGHAVGDAVLVQLARTMKAVLRGTDFLGRWGGEEFLLLCPKANHAAALQLAERIRAAVAGQTYRTGKSHTVSLGVATYRAGDTQDSLLQRADEAMYRAKQTGRNRVCGELLSEALAETLAEALPETLPENAVTDGEGAA
ncbi:GGDEF domain-containing protein [Azonexus sp.]|uniref:GGDEF domain-containing protein n=1 Tax=Azonexus sp. TaxID=1872668 RepID=UPI0039E62780